MYIDMSNFKSVKQFVLNFKKKYGKCDILINNAGIFSEKRMEND